jgi:hypothetical protein
VDYVPQKLIFSSWKGLAQTVMEPNIILNLNQSFGVILVTSAWNMRPTCYIHKTFTSVSSAIHLFNSAHAYRFEIHVLHIIWL